MADDEVIDSGDDLQTAAAAFGKILAGVPETPAEPKQEIQPQAEAQENAQEEGANVTENAEASGEEDGNQAAESVERAEATPQVEETKVAAQPAPVDDTAAKAAEEVQKTLTFARAFLSQLQTQVMGEFADIKTMDDLYKVGETDPARYNRFVIATQKMQNAVQQYQQFEKQAEATKAAANPSPKIDWAEEQKKLNELVPDLADPKKGPQLERDLNAFAKAKGVDPAGKTAAEIQILYEAWKGQNSAAAQAKALEAAKAKAKAAPPVQTPGTAKPKSSSKEDKANEAFQRLQRTGHDRDAADVFRHILSN